MAYPGTAGIRPRQPQTWQGSAAPTGGAAKRVLSPAAPTTAGQAQPKALKIADSSFVVFSTAEKDEIGIRTLVGEYAEGGSNHGKKFYKKAAVVGSESAPDVYLYFWDNRDGPAFTGWWFGNQVGGAQVWSRSKATSQFPPKSGWSIPWDGEVKPDLVVMSAKEKAMSDQNQAKMQQAHRLQEVSAKQATSEGLDWEQRVAAATEKVAEADVDTEQAIEDCQSAAEGGDESEISSAAEQLSKQSAALAEVQRFIAVESLAAQKAPPNLRAEMSHLGQRVKKLQATLKEESAKTKNATLIRVKQADEENEGELTAREKELEIQHSRQLEEMLPASMEKVDTAEDEVEKAAIAAAPLNIDTADDLRSVMLGAIKETEQRVRAAQGAIGEARRYISSKIAQVQRFVRTTKKTGLEEFNGLQERLNQAQEKLNGYKNARQDYENRVQAKKLYEELSEKLAGAEIEVEKAAMMTAPLGGESIEAIKETESALSAAQSALSQTSRLIDSKLKGAEKTASPEILEDVKNLQDRAKRAQEKLDDVRKAVKETQIRIAADSLLKDVSEKVSHAEDELQRMAEAELPFLKGNTVQGEELDGLIAESDSVALKVHTAISEAQTFVARKLVEVARFTEGPAKAVREEVDMLQKRLEDGRERLQQFKSGTADRKRVFYLQEVEAKVGVAETEVAKMTDATAALSGIGNVDTVSDSLKEAVEQANVCERTAQASIVAARKHLISTTAELKKLSLAGGGSGAELGKLQTRVNAMQQEIQKLRNLTKDAEERIRVKQMLAEVSVRLQSAEGDVDKVASFAAPLAHSEPSPEQVERIDKATMSAQTKLSATGKLVDVKLKSAQGFLKEDLQKMRGRVVAAEAKLNQVIRASKDQRERLEASELAAHALEKVEAVEAALKRVSEAELPFLKGIEVLATGAANTAVMDSEKAAAATQKAVGEARTFIVQKLAEAKQYSSGAAEACTKELSSLQKKLDASAAKLTEMKRDTAERKRRMQMQAANEKVKKVETAMQNLAGEMEKLSDDKLVDLSQDAVKGACREITEAEAEAQLAVSEARKFLAARTQEAKTCAEAQRAPMMAELSKLQNRLTQCQVELAKLSKQVTEREQRFVAQRLLGDAEENLQKLQKDTELATKAAEPLLAKDIGPRVAELRVQAFVEGLHAHQKSTGQTAEELFKSIGEGKTITEAMFVKFLDKLPETSGRDGASFTEEQARSVFTSVSGGKGTIAVKAFKEQLRERRICVVSTEASDASGKVVGSIEVGEGVEILEQKECDGVVRAQCILSRDGSSVWTTLADKDGSNFKVSATLAGRLESVEAFASGIFERCTDLSEQLDQKIVEVSSVKHGPLPEMKPKLAAVRAQLTVDRSSIEQMRKDIIAAKVNITQKRKEEFEGVQQKKVQAMSDKAIKEATSKVESAEAEVTKVVEGSKFGSEEKLAAMSIKELDAITKSSDSALQALKDAKAEIMKKLALFEAQKGTSRQFLLEPRVALTKLTSRAQGAERKCRAATEAARTALKGLVSEATKKARSALQKKKGNNTTDQLFEMISGGEQEISEKVFTKFFSGLPNHGLSTEQISLAFKEFGRHGLRKSGFAKALQEFVICQKPIAITDKFEIASSTTLRKLEAAETFEILEGPREDADAQLQRVHGRALRDGLVGWATLRGNQGTPFLKEGEKPFMCVNAEGTLKHTIEMSSASVRKLALDEVLEVVEGPRREVPKPEIVLSGSVCSDGATGWITLKDSKDTTFATPSKAYYVCKSTIAMTDTFDIKKCKVLRKVEVGEALEVLEGKEAKEDADVEITRLRFRAVRDGKEGYVTLQGNQGTTFAEPSKSHYTISRAVTLRSASAPDAAEIRTLKKGEVFMAKDEPVEDQPRALMVVQARAMEDGAMGWVTWSGPPAPVRVWMPRYVVRTTVPLTTKSEESSDPIRQAEVGEIFDCVEGPTLDTKSGLRRVRCATNGIAEGWATIRSSSGEVLLEVK